MGIGADGLETGSHEAAGYAIVGSVSRDGTRVFAAMSGMASDRERAEEARKLLDWGIAVVREDRALRQATRWSARPAVFGGEKSGVALKAKGPVDIFVPIANRDKLIARIVYEGPVSAPVEAGQPVGALRVWIGDTLSQETPLFAAETVGVGTLPQRALDAVEGTGCRLAALGQFQEKRSGFPSGLRQNDSWQVASASGRGPLFKPGLSDIQTRAARQGQFRVGARIFHHLRRRRGRRQVDADRRAWPKAARQGLRRRS